MLQLKKTHVTTLLKILVLFILLPSIALANCPEFAYGGKLPIAKEPIVLLCKKNFAIGFSKEKKLPLFVLQRLDPENTNAPRIASTATFKPDPLLERADQATLLDYGNSGFDRGHMAPSEDNAHDALASAESNYFTNIVPHNASNNRGIWRVLEGNVRALSTKEIIYVITGPVFNAKSATIGKSELPVPAMLYKIIINPQTGMSLTYVIPNANVPSTQLPSFISTREIARELTGIDLVPGGLYNTTTLGN